MWFVQDLGSHDRLLSVLYIAIDIYKIAQIGDPQSCLTAMLPLETRGLCIKNGGNQQGVSAATERKTLMSGLQALYIV